MEKRFLIEDWPGSAYQKFAWNFVSKNAWRVTEVVGDFNDCMGEAALVYTECRRRYGASAQNAKHFMALYKRCLVTWFNTLSSEDFKIRRSQELIPKVETQVQPQVDFEVALGEASSDLKAVIQLFTQAPKEVMDMLREEASSYSPRQFWNACMRFLGLSPEKSKAVSEELKTLLK